MYDAARATSPTPLDAPLATMGDAWLAAIRGRALERIAIRPARPPRPIVIAALLIALLLHALFAWWLRDLMQPPPPLEAGSIAVRILDEPVVEPALPEPPPRALPARVLPAPSTPMAEPVAASSSAPIQARMVPAPTVEASSTVPLSQLFNPDGSVRLPPAPPPTKHEKDIERGRELMARGHNMLHCKRGRYARGPNPEEQGNQAAADFATYQSMFHYPADDPLLRDVGAAQRVDATRELVTAREAARAQVCDD